jgi:hypothetical protein
VSQQPRCPSRSPAWWLACTRPSHPGQRRKGGWCMPVVDPRGFPAGGVLQLRSMDHLQLQLPAAGVRGWTWYGGGASRRWVAIPGAVQACMATHGQRSHDAAAMRPAMRADQMRRHACLGAGKIVHPSWPHLTCCLPAMPVDGFFLRRCKQGERPAHSHAEQRAAAALQLLSHVTSMREQAVPLRQSAERGMERPCMASEMAAVCCL